MSVSYHDRALEAMYLENILTLPLQSDMQRMVIKTPSVVFHDKLSKIIFKAIKSCLAIQLTPDFAVICKKVKEEGYYSELEVVEFLQQESSLYFRNVSSLEHILHELKTLFLKRLAVHITLEVNSVLAMKDFASLKRVEQSMRKFERAKNALFKLQTSFEEQIKLTIERINSHQEYVRSAYLDINRIIGGYSRKNVSVLAGKPSHNKTTFAINEAADMAKFANSKILFVSAEEPAEMIWRRIIAKEFLIDLEDMRFKKTVLKEDEILSALKPIYKDNFIILDQVYDPTDITSAILEYKPDMVIIDYVQRLNLGDDKTRGIEAAVTSFKNAAKKTDCHVKLLAQVDAKTIDKREDKVPRISDVMWSQFLHQESSEFAVIYWNYKHSLDETEKNLVDIIFWKNRYGGSGATKLYITPKYGKFNDVKH